jgi:hypothetical protein
MFQWYQHTNAYEAHRINGLCPLLTGQLFEHKEVTWRYHSFVCFDDDDDDTRYKMYPYMLTAVVKIISSGNRNRGFNTADTKAYHQRS